MYPGTPETLLLTHQRLSQYLEAETFSRISLNNGKTGQSKETKNQRKPFQ